MLPLTPRGERLGDQWPQTRGIGESSTDVAAQFLFELRKLLFDAIDLFENAWVLQLEGRLQDALQTRQSACWVNREYEVRRRVIQMFE